MLDCDVLAFLVGDEKHKARMEIVRGRIHTMRAKYLVTANPRDFRTILEAVKSTTEIHRADETSLIFAHQQRFEVVGDPEEEAAPAGKAGLRSAAERSRPRRRQ